MPLAFQNMSLHRIPPTVSIDSRFRGSIIRSKGALASQMGYNPLRLVLIALAAMTTCVALFACSKERALSPQMSKQVIYVGGSMYIPGSNPSRWYSVLYALDADSLHKVDSIVLEDYPSGVATTPDGRTLFISAYDLEARTPKILAVDGTTHRTMWSLENGLYGTWEPFSTWEARCWCVTVEIPLSSSTRWTAVISRRTVIVFGSLVANMTALRRL